MSVSFYDLLDVDETATAAEIRAAWKAAIADLEPTDRRFRAYNDAAGVLLDDAKRAAYDAELAASRAEEEPAAEEPAAEAAPTAVEEPAAEPDAEPTAEPDAEPTAEPDAEPTEQTAGPSALLLYVVAGLAVVVVALTTVVMFWPGSLGGDSPATREERVEDAATAAVAAAEVAVPVVLAYDYRTFDSDVAAAEEHLTDDFAAERDDLLGELREEVVSSKVVVTARVQYSGLRRVDEDGSRATVVVYVDQDSVKGDADPVRLRQWATLTMVADGDDWLIDDICVLNDCG